MNPSNEPASAIDDVPSPIDLRRIEDAREWAETAMSKRPYRAEVFARIAHELRATVPADARVLELGSGPGFLADALTSALPDLAYVALDFSASMHALAVQRLGPRAARITWLERDFLGPHWADSLGTFDAIVTVQAVHELRHKRRAVTLHRVVRTLLEPGAGYFVCDHFAGNGGMANDALFMTVEEQRSALAEAGFDEVETLLVVGSLALHRAV